MLCLVKRERPWDCCPQGLVLLVETLPSVQAGGTGGDGRIDHSCGALRLLRAAHGCDSSRPLLTVQLQVGVGRQQSGDRVLIGPTLCTRGELNSHALSDTSTSTMRVYHSATDAYSATDSNRCPLRPNTGPTQRVVVLPRRLAAQTSSAVSQTLHAVVLPGGIEPPRPLGH